MDGDMTMVVIFERENNLQCILQCKSGPILAIFRWKFELPVTQEGITVPDIELTWCSLGDESLCHYSSLGELVLH